MSPRGIATPDVREHLFSAAERVLSRDGADRLTSRAVTDEAGVAKGLLFNHFSDFDQFLAELAADRIEAASKNVASFPSRAGQGNVEGNLTEFAAALLQSDAFAIAGLIHSRPALMHRLHQASPGRHFSFMDEAETALRRYLDDETQCGRIRDGTDTDTLAFVLIGAIHHLFITNAVRSSELRRRIQSIIALLLPVP